MTIVRWDRFKSISSTTRRLETFGGRHFLVDPRDCTPAISWTATEELEIQADEHGPTVTIRCISRFPPQEICAKEIQ
jgi:hypothetical protein